MAPSKKLVESRHLTEDAHVFTEYAGECGDSWSTDQGDKCPLDGTQGYLSKVA